MRGIHHLRRPLSMLLYIVFTVSSLQMPAAQAAMIGTDRVLSETAAAQSSQARDRLDSLLARDEVAQKLVEYGVEPQQARERIAGLTNSEILELQERIDTLPAGGDILGVAALIFIVLIITDAIGATDVFTFVNKVE
ncbi:PA2779 family protein [Thiohalomonas denitrificans]|uniref:PA2779 family protein n=1 Tax=Thiohalomonas denitrificans TaxID=415747 RepID=A0A1G5Q7C9_9GAMM|nr:PA2779 family protein [Thiohalomonas denitrificans]SCZ57785.1 hypothetical protein SAMN03097708_01508 [Thiohalomonas denitrificans]